MGNSQLGPDTAIRIWELDYTEILRYAPKDQPILYTTAKIALVGDSGVGKSGLGYRIARKMFIETPSTHGQQFWVVDELGKLRKDGTQCEAVLWDFAGQPDYRLIHALFLVDVDLALLLFDPGFQQDPLKGVEFWVKQLESETCQKILIAARTDRAKLTLTDDELKTFCEQHNITGGWISTSARDNIGIAELVVRIKELIFWERMTTTVTTLTFKLVKDFVLEQLKADPLRQEVLISWETLRELVNAFYYEKDPNWKSEDVEIQTAVRHLQTHGYVSILRSASGAETILSESRKLNKG